MSCWIQEYSSLFRLNPIGKLQVPETIQLFLFKWV